MAIALDPIKNHFQSFEDEPQAEQFVYDSLKPFCKKIERQVLFPSSGLRPDIGFRLMALPEIPLLAEVKNFVVGKGLASVFCDAIAQASSYSELTHRAVFIAPLFANGVMELDWLHSPIGWAILIAAEFNVGVLAFTPKNPRYPTNRIGGLLLGGQAVATFTMTQYGEPATTLHSNAAHLLKFKERFGSSTRKLG